VPGNSFGQLFRITTWGESHGPAIGGVIDGCPAGIPLSEKDIQPDLDRRRPGQSDVTTPRNELDEVKILSGVFEGKTTGTPISLIIQNTDQQSKDYSKLKTVHRPQHADATYDLKYGFRDYRGGGRSSARETAMRVAAAAIAKKMFQHLGLNTQVIAFTQRIQELEVTEVDYDVIETNPVRAANTEVAQQMEQRILELKEQGDSVGAILQIDVNNCPAGLGEPVFDKIKGDFAKALLSVNAVLGFEYGAGFEAGNLKGSENNQRKNGIYGGITDGEPITMRVAIKPTSSIKLDQMKDNKAKGRHDPCLAPRAVPILEAMTWLVIADHYLRQMTTQLG
jgi:chorismate synthase